MSLADPLPIAAATRPLDASIRLPGSKSLSNRHLILAALSDGPSRLTGLLSCDDCDRLLAALEAFGVHATAEGSSILVKHGARAERARVDLGDGGTPTRFMVAFAAAQPSGEFVIDGSARMRERPIAEGIAMLRVLGARIEYLEAEGQLPVLVHGGGLTGGRIEVGRTASSQFVSALMLVAPSLARGLEVRFTEDPTSASYLHLSLAALAAHGVHAEIEYGPVALDGRARGAGLSRIEIPRQTVHASEVQIEPDASSAVYPAATAAIVGGTVTIEGLPRRSAQPDSYFLDDLSLRGAMVEEHGGPPLATLITGTGRLRGFDSDYACAPDAAVMAMVVAACADSPSTLTGLETLRVKESDRIAAVAAGLRALGGTVDVGEDWARVHPLPARLTPAAIDTANDHRIAMAFAVLGLARAGVSIRNPGCVRKSWPGFWEALEGLCCENRPR